MVNTSSEETEALFVFVIVFVYLTVKSLRSALGMCNSQECHQTPHSWLISGFSNF